MLNTYHITVTDKITYGAVKETHTKVMHYLIQRETEKQAVDHLVKLLRQTNPSAQISLITQMDGEFIFLK
jgi:hypothetical protein